MNIFVLDRDPGRAARFHCDRHVVKMVLESALLLSTVIWDRDDPDASRLQLAGRLYRPTHARHPCTLWAGTSRGNFHWLVRLALGLAEEYTYRYGKEHRSRVVVDAAQAWLDRTGGGTGRGAADWPVRRTPFAQAMPEQYRGLDAVAAYRAYYRGDKAPICRWTRRPVPRWFGRPAD